MKSSTIRSLLTVCVVLDLALIGVVLYDYFENDSAWIVGVLVVFGIFVLITAILFLMTGRTPEGERVVIKEVVREVQPAVPQVIGTPATIVVHEFRPIPPAPIRVLQEAPPRRMPTPPPRVDSGIPFVYNGYTLFTKVVQLKNGGKRPIYFFSKRKPKSGRMCAKPSGFHVGVNERTGLPFLKKGRGPDGEDLTPALAEAAYRPQCSALTEEGAQCRNSAREGSKYCASHFGYQPPVLAKATVDRKDTLARVKDAPDTKPSTRKSWFGRRKRAAA
jgi:hypothetical protein